MGDSNRGPSAEKKRSLAGRNADIQRAIIYSVIDFWRHHSAHSDFQVNFCTAGLAPLCTVTYYHWCK